MQVAMGPCGIARYARAAKPRRSESNPKAGLWVLCSLFLMAIADKLAHLVHRDTESAQ